MAPNKQATLCTLSHVLMCIYNAWLDVSLSARLLNRYTSWPSHSFSIMWCVNTKHSNLWGWHDVLVSSVHAFECDERGRKLIRTIKQIPLWSWGLFTSLMFTPYDLIRHHYYDLGRQAPCWGNSIYCRLPADSTVEGWISYHVRRNSPGVIRKWAFFG